jgi:hypothetical protein
VLVLSPYQPPTPDYAIETQIQVLTDKNADGYDFGIVFRSDASGNGYVCGVVTDFSPTFTVDVWQGSSSSSSGTSQQNYTVDNGWRTYRVEVKGNTVFCFVE